MKLGIVFLQVAKDAQNIADANGRKEKATISYGGLIPVVC